MDFDEMVLSYSRLIQKLAYHLYSQYHTVLDFEDARQEVLILFYRCCLYYNPSKNVKFITFFISSFKRLKSRLYYSYFHQINVANKSIPMEEVKNVFDIIRENIGFEDSSNENKNQLLERRIKMAKRYSKDEISKIVELKNSGMDFSSIRSKVKELFGNDRTERVLKIIYDRHKNAEQAGSNAK